MDPQFAYDSMFDVFCGTPARSGHIKMWMAEGMFPLPVSCARDCLIQAMFYMTLSDYDYQQKGKQMLKEASGHLSGTIKARLDEIIENKHYKVHGLFASFIKTVKRPQKDKSAQIMKNRLQNCSQSEETIGSLNQLPDHVNALISLHL